MTYLKTLTCFIFILSSTLISQINTEILRQEPSKKGLTHLLQSQLNIVQGNSDFLSYNISYRADLISKSLKSFLVISLNELQTQSIAINKYNFAHLRILKPLSEELGIETFFQQEYNPFLDLNKRQLLGLVFRKQLNDTKNNSKKRIYFIGIGAMIEEETYTNNSKTQSLRSSNYLTITHHLSDTMSLKSINYYQPKIAQLDDFKILSENIFSTAIHRNINLNIHGNIRLNNVPPTNVKKYDIEIIQSININF